MCVKMYLRCIKCFSLNFKNHTEISITLSFSYKCIQNVYIPTLKVAVLQDKNNFGGVIRQLTCTVPVLFWQHIIRDRAMKILQFTDPDTDPLFLYLPFQAAHGPLQVLRLFKFIEYIFNGCRTPTSQNIWIFLLYLVCIKWILRQIMSTDTK